MPDKRLRRIVLGSSILIALGLVILFNIFPRAYGPLFVFVLLALILATLYRQYWLGRLTFFDAGKSTIANYCLVVAGICLIAYLVRMVVILTGDGATRFTSSRL